MDNRVQHVIELIRDNLRHDLSHEELARAVNLSASRLSHLFTGETGMSLSQYIKALRMEQAKEMLETTFLKTKEIMYLVGLGDESHFVRDFKKAYGLPPARYRAQHLHPVWSASPRIMGSSIGQ